MCTTTSSDACGLGDGAPSPGEGIDTKNETRDEVSEPGSLYFETGRGYCGLHALNNAVGHHWQTIADIAQASAEYKASMHNEHALDKDVDDADLSESITSEVLCWAIQRASKQTRGGIGVEMKLKPLHQDPDMIYRAYGAIVNVQNKHWVALKAERGVVWKLDSQVMKPCALSAEEYREYVVRYRDAYPLVPLESPCTQPKRVRFLESI